MKKIIIASLFLAGCATIGGGEQTGAGIAEVLGLDDPLESSIQIDTSVAQDWYLDDSYLFAGINKKTGNYKILYVAEYFDKNIRRIDPSKIRFVGGNGLVERRRTGVKYGRIRTPSGPMLYTSSNRFELSRADVEALASNKENAIRIDGVPGDVVLLGDEAASLLDALDDSLAVLN